MVAFTRSQVKCGETPQKKITSERSAYACCGFRMDWCWRTPRGSCAKCGSRSRRLGARVGPGKSIPLTRLATHATLSPRERAEKCRNSRYSLQVRGLENIETLDPLPCERAHTPYTVCLLAADKSGPCHQNSGCFPTMNLSSP